MESIAHTSKCVAAAAGQTGPAADPWGGGDGSPGLKEKIDQELNKGNILIVMSLSGFSTVDPPYATIVAVLSVFQDPEVVWKDIVNQWQQQNIFNYNWLELQSYNPEYYHLDGIDPDEIIATTAK